jgi:hypothetical protein
MNPIIEASLEAANPRVAWIVIAGVLLLLVGEGGLLWHQARSNSAIDQENGHLREALVRTKARTDELRTNEARIKALHARLNDAIVVRKGQSDDRLPLPRAANPKDQKGDPPVIKAFRESGCEVLRGPNELGNLSVTYALRSSGVEFHRLVPLIAQQENSNTFLVVDNLTLGRPESTPTFSKKPTALNARLVLRLLAANP